MKLGIDFGTSYSAAAAFVNGKVEPILFDGEPQFRTAIFFPDIIPNPEDFPHTAETDDWIQREYAVLLRQQTTDANNKAARRADYERKAAKARQDAKTKGGLTPEQDARIAQMLREDLALVGDAVMRTPEELQRDARRIVRRLWLEREMKRPRGASNNIHQALFGEQAIDAYLSEHRGNLVQSPKSMLGQRMDDRVRSKVFMILCHTLEHIRLTATQQLGVPVRGATLGRPVEFRSSMGDEGSVQAQQMLEAAARAAGFDEIDFLEEPRAAAFRFHQETAQASRALIVDIGGGTSDIAWGVLGGDAPAPTVAGSCGNGFGGTDIDFKLSLEAFMPHFGREQAGIPLIIFSLAANISSLPEQAQFLAMDLKRVPAPFQARLKALQTFGATTLLNREVETAKIALGKQELHSADLAEIVTDMRISATRTHLQNALTNPASWLGKLDSLLAVAATESALPPELVFLTGGASRAPYVHEAVKQAFPGARIVQGDASFGVVQGLARFAGRQG